jgi:hypothetical protein
MLVEDFDKCVVDDLDRVSREAIRNQEKIQDPRTFGAVKRAIEDKIVNLLIEHTDNKSVPPQAFFKKIHTTLANKYSYMFLEDPTTEVNGMTVRLFDQRGAGGVLGVDHVPKSLAQKYRRIIDKLNAKGHTGKENDEEAAPKKKTRVGHVYGVDQAKFNASSKVVVDNNLVEHLEGLYDPNEKEEAYAANRSAVQKLLSSGLEMLPAVPGFFEDQRHCQFQFEWLTNKTIVNCINKEIPTQFEYLKLVLSHWITTKDFRLRAEAIKLKCADLDGSKIPEYVFLIRELSQLWHSKKSGLFRTDEEEGPTCVHIVYKETTDGYRY